MRQVRVKKCMLFGLYSWPLEEKMEDHFKKLQGRVPKKLRKFGHMSKLGPPYVPSTLMRTKISLNKYYPRVGESRGTWEPGSHEILRSDTKF